jgi:hypothetical protein
MNLIKKIVFLFVVMLSIIMLAPTAFAQRNAHPKERKHVVQKINKKVVELKKTDDDIDDVYYSNETHMRDYSNEK